MRACDFFFFYNYWFERYIKKIEAFYFLRSKEPLKNESKEIFFLKKIMRCLFFKDFQNIVNIFDQKYFIFENLCDNERYFYLISTKNVLYLFIKYC